MPRRVHKYRPKHNHNQRNKRVPVLSGLIAGLSTVVLLTVLVLVICRIVFR